MVLIRVAERRTKHAVRLCSEGTAIAIEHVARRQPGSLSS